MKQLFGCGLIIVGAMHAAMAITFFMLGANSPNGSLLPSMLVGALLFVPAAVCTIAIGSMIRNNKGYVASLFAPNNTTTTENPIAAAPAPYIPPTKRQEEIQHTGNNTPIHDAEIIASPVTPQVVTEIDNVPVPISVHLKTIFVQMTNFDLEIYDDKMLFDLVFTNHTGSRIRAFKGDLVFWDLFDAEIFRIGITMNTPIKSGKTAKWSGEFQYNQFQSDHIHLAGFKASDLRVSLDKPQIAG